MSQCTRFLEKQLLWQISYLGFPMRMQNSREEATVNQNLFTRLLLFQLAIHFPKGLFTAGRAALWADPERSFSPERAGGQGRLGRATHEGWTAARAFTGHSSPPSLRAPAQGHGGQGRQFLCDKSLGKRALDTRLTVLDINFLHRHFRIWAFPSPYPQVHTCYNIVFRKQMKIIMTPQELSK